MESVASDVQGDNIGGKAPDATYEKTVDDILTWGDLSKFRDMITARFDKKLDAYDESLRRDLQQMDINIEKAASQESVDIMQESVTNLTRQVTHLSTQLEQRGHDDDWEPGRAQAYNGRGGFAARRIQAHDNHREDAGLGKPKFSIPPFTFDTDDVEEYLMWELKIEKLWRLHDYNEDRKIKLASSSFDGYALLWWDNITQLRAENGDPEVVTWATMKQLM